MPWEGRRIFPRHGETGSYCWAGLPSRLLSRFSAPGQRQYDSEKDREEQVAVLRRGGTPEYVVAYCDLSKQSLRQPSRHYRAQWRWGSTQDGCTDGHSQSHGMRQQLYDRTLRCDCTVS